VQDRIWKTYRREADVIHPPVDVDSFYWKPPEGYYLAVSELVPYKRIDLAVRHFSRTGQRLCIAGAGPELPRLKQAAARNIEFLGRVPDEALRELYARCRAFLLPGEEDFGMTAVEALASGKPVIALGRGGALETVPPSCGVLFDAPTGESLAEAIRSFEMHEGEFEPAMLQSHAQRFRPAEFNRKMAAVLAQALEPARGSYQPLSR
jgi:glycosyltransferase involved in cell wall biosynthesis